MKKITFIGLGNIGYWVAGNLAKAGYEVTVYNRTHAKAEKWQSEYSGKAAKTIKQAVIEAEIIITCVSNDKALDEVYFADDGVVVNMPEGIQVIDHSTVSVTISKKIAASVEQKNGSFFDAPVSGGSIGAQKGVLAVMVGGDSKIFKDLEEVIGVYSSSATLVGPSGSGQLTKMINQICTSANISAVAEGMALARAAGLDQEMVVEAIKSGAAGSWMMNNRSQPMIKETFVPGFEANLMLKDLKLALDEANSQGLDTPQLALARKRYQQLADFGYGSEDMSAIYRLVNPS